MRLDYALYGLAIVLFIIAAITVVMVEEQQVQIIYATSTAVVGALCVAGGYFLRPKAQVASEPATTQTAAPTQQAVAAEQIQQTTVPVVEAPKTETSIMEVPLQEANVAVEASKVDSSSIEVPIAVEPASSVGIAPKIGLMEAKSTFSQIRGISAKRAEELKANGISTVQDLANASAEELASKLNVSPKIVKMWIGSAKKLK